jgi:hypothetical protein
MFLLTGDGAVVRTRHYQPYPTLMTAMRMKIIKMPQVQSITNSQHSLLGHKKGQG